MSYKKLNKEDYAKKRKDQLVTITEKLENGIKELMNSDKYKAYLKTMGKFHHYSVNNSLLIALQRPDATLVAGYEAWKSKFGRQVKEGEKGIKIMAPAPYTKKEEVGVVDNLGNKVLDSNGNQKTETIEVVIPAFRVATVFDLAQTEGKELPNIGTTELKGEIADYKNLKDALIHVSPVPIEEIKIDSGAKGYFSPAKQLICINEGMSEMQEVKTLIHEIAHSLLHDKGHERIEVIENSSDKSRNRKEVEAESVAYTVCQALGGDKIDTSDYSFSYIAGWSADKELSDLKESLETIRITADKIISGVEAYLMEKSLVKEEHKDLGVKSFKEELASAKKEQKEMSKRKKQSKQKDIEIG